MVFFAIELRFEESLLRTTVYNQPGVDFTAETHQQEISTRTRHQIQPDNTRYSIDGTDVNSVRGGTTMVAAQLPRAFEYS